jgi:hypothetical protein
MKRLAVFCLLATLLLPACESGLPEANSAVLTISVSPLPVVVRWACPQHAPIDPPPANCFLTMDPVVTIAESAGIGARMEGLTLSVRDGGATGPERVNVSLGRDWIVANAGSDVIAGNANLSFRVLINEYPLPFAPRPNLTLLLVGSAVDERGNRLNPQLNLDIR